ncbi:MAG: DUF4157 domain-containing protein [Alphaproteobacteria bacterium]
MHSHQRRELRQPARRASAPAPRPGTRAGLPQGQRRCPCGGGCVGCGGAAALPSGVRLGAPGDRLERDADRAAEAAMRMPDGTAGHAPLRALAPQPAGAIVPGSGRPLDPATRAFMEPRFGADFGHVRVHADGAAAAEADSLDAAAFTLGSHIAFGAGRHALDSAAGLRLIAHELAHTIQPDAGAVVRRKPKVEVRSPVLEETVTQLSEVAGAAAGRPLMEREIALAMPVFGRSVDYTRVRLIGAEVPQFVTIGNNIYVPPDFSIGDAYHAQTLIHELVHVWQYQRGGTAYISRALAAQIGGMLKGSRNLGYDYTLTPDAAFYEYNPEQQGLIVEHYFAMTRDEAEITAAGAAAAAATAAGTAPAAAKRYVSNHMDASGNWKWISAADRLAEIRRELPAHEALMAQVRASVPQPEFMLLQQRAAEVMRTPGQGMFPTAPERELTPVKPLLEIRF